MLLSLSRTSSRRLGDIATYLILITAIIVIAFPFYWMLRSSLIPSNRLLKMPIEYFPTKISVESYVYLITRVPFMRWFLNTIIVAGSTTLITVVVGSLAGYSLARFKFKYKRLLLLGILACNMMPRVVLAIPFFDFLNRLSLVNTYPGLILAYISFSLPFCIWMLDGYFKSIPEDLENSAMIDGCTRVQALRKIIMPLAIPGVLATGTYAFILSWAEFMVAMALTTSEEMRTLPVGLAGFIGQYSAEWGLIMAGGVLGVIPVLIVFALLQKYLVEGLTKGAIK